ncbi:MAG: DUF885 domain-containing protein, partial [Gammaproteobacteria bacterium]|nr:DUF885 domain-containing protein [Gammaproteobacteria bacterium]
MFLRTAAIVAAALCLYACGGEPDESGAAADAPETLATLLDEYFEKNLELNPLSATSIGDDRYDDRYANSIGPEYRAARHELNTTFLQRLESIDRSALNRQEILSYDMFKLARESALAAEAYPSHLAPMNQFRSATSSFVRLGSGSGLHPFETVKNYDDFLSRIGGFTAYVDQAIANMREGIDQGVTQPKILMQKFLPQLESQLVDSVEESGFYSPIETMPEDFSAADRERLTEAYKVAIERQLIPAFARLHHFIETVYIPAARESVGLLALPNGDDWYAHNVRVITTTELTPEEIHQIGLNEVQRIHDEMRGVMQKVGFDGDLQDFFQFVNEDPAFFYSEPEQLIQAYRDMSADIEK